MAEAGLRGRTVVLCVGAGIAAYKAVEVCRRLVDLGAHVVVVMTKDAQHFVGPMTFSALASEPVATTLWDVGDPLAHTRLAARADVVVVAPATADLLARYAHGMANDMVTATLLATTAPVLVAPAMHTAMWEHPATRDNLSLLRDRGVSVVEPVAGHLAGGDSGMGRMSEPERIVDAALKIASERSGAGNELSGRRVLVTAGGTREPIDPVRYVGNRSSGKQGHAIALEAAARGAQVVLVTASEAPVGAGATTETLQVVSVETAEEMARAVLASSDSCDVIVMAAAVADFRPAEVVPSKWKKSQGPPEIRLVPTTDILGELVQRRHDGQVLIGFAAETGNLLDQARSKLSAKGVDLIVANDVSADQVGFGHETNAVVILGDDGTQVDVPLTSKDKVARSLWDVVVARTGWASQPASA